MDCFINKLKICVSSASNKTVVVQRHLLEIRPAENPANPLFKNEIFFALALSKQTQSSVKMACLLKIEDY